MADIGDKVSKTNFWDLAEKGVDISTYFAFPTYKFLAEILCYMKDEKREFMGNMRYYSTVGLVGFTASFVSSFLFDVSSAVLEAKYFQRPPYIEFNYPYFVRRSLTPWYSAANFVETYLETRQ